MNSTYFKQILPEGIPLDLVVIDKDNGKFLNTYKCQICNNLVVNARECSLCNDGLYCHDCSLTNNEECLVCHKGKSLKPLSKREREILKDFQIKCIFVQQGCFDIIGYGEYVEHIAGCTYNNILNQATPNENEEKESINEEESSHLKFDFHVNNKNNNYKLTDIYHPSHFTKDKDMVIKCSFCFARVKDSEKLAHILLCEKFTIKCKDCSKPIKRFKYPFHNHGRCFMKMLHFYEKFRKQAEKLEQCNTIIKAYEKKGELITESTVNEAPRLSVLSPKKKKLLKKKLIKQENDLENQETYNDKESRNTVSEIEDENDSVNLLKTKRNKSKVKVEDIKEEIKNIRNDISLLKDISISNRTTNKNKKYLNDYQLNFN